MQLPPLDSAVWQFWGFVAAVIGILIAAFISLVIYRLQEKRKKCTYDLLTEAPVVEPARSYASRVKVLFDDQEVTRVHSVVVRLENSGNTAIRREDYDEHIKVSFPTSGPILEAVIYSARPDNLKPSLANNGHIVDVEPILLNKRWYIDLACLVSNYAGQVAVTAVIADVDEISRKRKDKASPPTMRQLYFALGFGFFSLTIATISIILKTYTLDFMEFTGLMGLYGLALISTLLIGLSIAGLAILSEQARSK